MDKFVLSEEDIKQLFHRPPSQPTEPPARSPFPVQKASPQFPRTPDDAEYTPPSPFHRLPASTQSKRTPQPPRPVADYTPAKARYHSKRQRLVRALSMFAVSFFLSFGLLNGGTYGSRLTYWWSTDIMGRDPVTPEELQRLTGESSVQDIPSNTPAESTPSSTPSPSRPTSPRLPATPVILPANRLLIPKIGVDAPVVWNADPANILGDLQKGVAHYRGTALPNETSGNVFVTGHSSGFVWDRSPYTTVFANLDKLVAGDLIAVTTDNSEYIYRVKDSVVVRPTETSVLSQTPIPILSLMTCTPVGTNLRRLVVRADLFRVIPLADTDRSTPL